MRWHQDDKLNTPQVIVTTIWAIIFLIVANYLEGRINPWLGRGLFILWLFGLVLVLNHFGKLQTNKSTPSAP